MAREMPNLQMTKFSVDSVSQFDPAMNTYYSPVSALLRYYQVPVGVCSLCKGFLWGREGLLCCDVVVHSKFLA